MYSVTLHLLDAISTLLVARGAVGWGPSRWKCVAATAASQWYRRSFELSATAVWGLSCRTQSPGQTWSEKERPDGVNVRKIQCKVRNDVVSGRRPRKLPPKQSFLPCSMPLRSRNPCRRENEICADKKMKSRGLITPGLYVICHNRYFSELSFVAAGSLLDSLVTRRQPVLPPSWWFSSRLQTPSSMRDCPEDQPSPRRACCTAPTRQHCPVCFYLFVCFYLLVTKEIQHSR